MVKKENVGAGPVSAHKYNANAVGACIARPQDKNNANAVGAGPVSAQGSHTMRPLQINKQNAITLIALIITIIIMLILAGVVLNLTIGEHGIFKTAQNAAKNYVQKENEELAMLNEFDNLVNNKINTRRR